MIQFNFSPFKTLSTNRLILRRMTMNDADAVYKIRSNQTVMKYIPRPLATHIEMAIENIKMIDDKLEKNEGINWAITRKNKDELIGYIGFYRTYPERHRAEVGYMLHPDYFNQGITHEALAPVIEYGFKDMNLHSIEAVIDPENIASEKVLLKHHFKKEAHFIENDYFDGKYINSAVYSLLKRNWQP